MFLTRLTKGKLIAPLKYRIRFFSSVPLPSKTVETVSIANNLEIDEFRQQQLARLQCLKPSDFTPSALNQLIADFLVSPNKPDTILAGRLLDKFLFKVPEIDENGDLVTLYLLQLIQNGEISSGIEFVLRLLKESQIPVTPFIMECILKGIIDSKSDELGLNLLKTIKETENSQLINLELSEQLIIELFLPRLNWPAIDFIIAESVTNSEVQQINISSSVLQEIFQVLLAPHPNDPYYDALENEPFTGNLVNPRFHRLLQLLERWKHTGIPIKGKQISKALEDIFKNFLPTESMMKELQKLA